MNDLDEPDEPPYVPDAWHAWLSRTSLSAGRPYVQLPAPSFRESRNCQLTGNRLRPVATTIQTINIRISYLRKIRSAKSCHLVVSLDLRACRLYTHRCTWPLCGSQTSRLQQIARIKKHPVGMLLPSCRGFHPNSKNNYARGDLLFQSLNSDDLHRISL